MSESEIVKFEAKNLPVAPISMLGDLSGKVNVGEFHGFAPGTLVIGISSVDQEANDRGKSWFALKVEIHYRADGFNSSVDPANGQIKTLVDASGRPVYAEADFALLDSLPGFDRVP
jgi:hypothetical protein